MKLLLTADPEVPVPPRLYGGIERIVDDLLVALRMNGHEVALVAHPESSAATDRLYPWPRTTSKGLTDTIANMSCLAAAVRKFKPDLVHSFSRLFYMLPFLSSNMPKIMTYQRHPTEWTVRLARLSDGGSLRFTGCSNYIAEIGKSYGGQWQNVPNFVDVSKYTYRSTVPDDAPLLFLSRVEHVKGAHLAIATALELGRPLKIAGNRPEGDAQRIYWEGQIQPHLGHNGIEYVGPVDDLEKNALLGQSAALLVPIQWDEPFGIVFVEALACGTPVVSMHRGALPEIIENGVHGFLCHSTSALSAAVASIGKINRAACRARVEEAFSLEAVVPQYEKLYRQVLGKH